MRLKTLVDRVRWVDVRTVLLRRYPDEKKNFLGYIEVLRQLKAMTPQIVDDLELMVQWQPAVLEEDRPYVKVYARPPEDPGFRHGVDCRPWAQVLGMKVAQDAMDEFTLPEIVAHALWEITFYGFDEQDVGAFWQSVHDTVERIKAGEEEMIPLSELDRYLGDKN